MTMLTREKCVACRRDSPRVTDEEVADCTRRSQTGNLLTWTAYRDCKEHSGSGTLAERSTLLPSWEGPRMQRDTTRVSRGVGARWR
ncbi:hypothetical protein GBAR_LOCUS6396 [Geodia barretti]|uniref:Uncharacterized protein n=2 Tax=Geodia barretti TaxID=519541 RepID=A0AA35RDM3_GEOBA|nr:hypothetical protein GBAR_LOCUS6396 [Geodia barretti]